MRKLTIWLSCLMFFLSMSLAYAQTKTITGNVTSSKDGLPIPGATIIVPGTTIGTITDIEGNYTLEVDEDVITLRFQFVGMMAQDVTIGNSTVINVAMEEDTFLLGEVIVTGYTTRGKNEITGSTVQISGNELSEVPVVTVDQALQGKVAGLNISATSGTPGTIQDIRIRGVSSITANNDPLFVIDGVPVINQNISGSSFRTSLSTLASLNSADIETITVLKDASATSAYGARGSNGVIVITTKRGKSGKTKFNFSSSYGFQNDATEGRQAITGLQKEELYLEGILNTFGEEYGLTTPAQAWTFAQDNSLYGSYALNAWIEEGRPEVNWDKATGNDDAPILNASFSATGGDEKQSFYTSLSYNKTEATVKGVDFKRVTGVLNYNRNFADNVKFSFNANVANIHQGGLLENGGFFANPRLSSYFFTPWVNPYDEDGNPNIDYAGRSNLFNYLYLAEHDIVYNDLTRATVNSFIDWELIDNLTYTSKISMDYSIDHYKNYQNRNHGDQLPEGGSTYSSYQRNFNWVFQNSLNYEWIFKENHRFNFRVLMEFQKNKYDYVFAYGENFPADGLTNIDNASANFAAGSAFTDWNNLSYLGMINYNYLGRYIFDATYRREGSSRFAPENRFGDFYAFGAAWNISQEPFLSNISWINTLRLRASYGLSGSSGVDLNVYQALLSFDVNYDNNGGAYPSQFGNSFLSWEKNRNWDRGIDFSLFDNRISGSFAEFFRTTFDLLQDVPLSRTTGHNNFVSNVGEMINKGIEIVLNGDIIRSKDFNASISVNFATLKNRVTKLALDGNGEEININPTGNQRVASGHVLNEWYMRKWAGVDPETGQPLWYLNGRDGQTTTDYYAAEIEFQGTGAIPKYTGGVNIHIDYKGLYVDTDVAFQGGNQIYENWGFYTHHSGTTSIGYNGVAELYTRWRQPGDITDFPMRVHDSNASHSSRPSTRFLFDGDYIRLRNLVIGYDFPKSIISKLNFDGLRIYVRGTNLATWVKDKKFKYDPEVRANGYTQLTTPPVKSIIFGLTVNF